MARDVSDSTPITSRDELVAWFEAGSTPPERFAIGTEHEKIPFYRACHSAVPYEGRPTDCPPASSFAGVRGLLEGMRAKLGWEAICDGAHIIGLYDEWGGGAISLEPGGQFELSGAPLATIHQTEAELDRHFAVLQGVAAAFDIGFLSLGMNPKRRLSEIPTMPKQRYAIMANYMPKVGERGLDMMFRTSTVQANLDFSSEADMVQKLRVSLALQPVATALFANSPFTDGKLNGFLSARSEIWRHTDAARTGTLAFAFEPGMGFERYVDYALDVPMYFVKRGETYIDVAGASFRDLLAGKLDACPGEQATLSDWANHLSTIFPEVRLKRYLEMRGADAGPRPMLTALPALFAGLLYDSAALDQAHQLIKPWTADDREKLRADTPRLGLDAKIAGRPLRDVARDVLSLARAGLNRRARLDEQGRDEAYFLDPLDVIAEGRTEAERLIDLFKTEWGGSVEPAFEQCAY
ncbi:Glutamate--cysteine ligase [Methylocella tundrae]|uniref:Glutamate--cysteine ligase n=1 Tax=Methylocella tundrae TaxID=227605 RepID=A0A8B6M4Y0_METTU|nr:glutamate--cysteine ligase [Methylocella tundrae]VTZ49419.1 Glutamate--cysteine ligase [Methylocella tundrae]